MPELFTVPLERGVLDAMVARLRTVPGKPVPRNMIAVVTLRGRTPPPLTGYEIGAACQIHLTTPLDILRDPSLLHEVVLSIPRLNGFVSSVLCLAPSGKRFSIDDSSDVDLVLGRDLFDSYVELRVGPLSDGYTDLKARVLLFNLMLRSAGLSDQIEVVVRNGLLSVDSREFACLDLSCPYSEYPAKRESGRRFYATQSGEFDGSNFRDLRVYFAAMGDAHSAATKTLVDGFGIKSTLGQKLFVVVSPGEYDTVRAAVSSVLPSAEWTVMFCAKQRFGIDDISGAFDSMSGFLITLYTAKIPKAGSIDVAVHHDKDGCTQMSFTLEKSTSKAYEAVRAFAADLAGGLDVIEVTE